MLYLVLRQFTWAVRGHDVSVILGGCHKSGPFLNMFLESLLAVFMKDTHHIFAEPPRTANE